MGFKAHLMEKMQILLELTTICIVMWQTIWKASKPIRCFLTLTFMRYLTRLLAFYNWICWCYLARNWPIYRTRNCSWNQILFFLRSRQLQPWVKISYIPFFLFFCEEMIRVVCAMLTVVIKDLEVHLGNSNLPLRKSVIWFELLALKRETGQQTADILYYWY